LFVEGKETEAGTAVHESKPRLVLIAETIVSVYRLQVYAKRNIARVTD
jgi:hypothetical protein